MPDEDPPRPRPNFERLEAWCRDGRRWRLASGLVPLLVGVVTIGMVVTSGEEGLQAEAQLLFGSALCVAAVLPLLRALDRSDALRLVGAVRQRWDERARQGGTDEDFERLRAILRRVMIERMGVHP